MTMGKASCAAQAWLFSALLTALAEILVAAWMIVAFVTHSAAPIDCVVAHLAEIEGLDTTEPSTTAVLQLHSMLAAIPQAQQAIDILKTTGTEGLCVLLGTGFLAAIFMLLAVCYSGRLLRVYHEFVYEKRSRRIACCTGASVAICLHAILALFALVVFLIVLVMAIDYDPFGVVSQQRTNFEDTCASVQAELLELIHSATGDPKATDAQAIATGLCGCLFEGMDSFAFLRDPSIVGTAVYTFAILFGFLGCATLCIADKTAPAASTTSFEDQWAVKQEAIRAEAAKVAAHTSANTTSAASTDDIGLSATPPSSPPNGNSLHGAGGASTSEEGARSPTRVS